MVPELLRAANRRVRNPDGAAAIEVMGALTVRAETTITVATDVLPAHVLRTGEELTVVSDRRRVTYLALRGGVGAPVVLGSRSTQLSAGLGQMLNAGARLEAGSAPVYGDGTPGVRLRAFAGQPSILVIAGPDLDAFTADALTCFEQPRRNTARRAGIAADRPSRRDASDGARRHRGAPRWPADCPWAGASDDRWVSSHRRHRPRGPRAVLRDPARGHGAIRDCAGGRG
jgi:hypothetical protein